MYYLTLCALVLAIFRGANGDCDDCIHYEKCPNALNLAQNHKTAATRKTFQDAACDPTGTQPLVCCSFFSITGSKEDERIAEHRNLNLLPEKCGVIAIERIVGGREANLYEFPWMALLSYRSREGLEFKCGGSIINKRYVLTAAHCVVNKTLAGVRVGEHDIMSKHDCVKGICETYYQDLPIEEAIAHEKYTSVAGNVLNDIALLRVASDIDFNHKNVHPICLPTTSRLRQRTLDNIIATVSGWGFTEKGDSSNILLKVEIPIYTAERCSSIYNRYTRPGQPDATTNQLCAGITSKDSCNGDSGGPLITEDTGKKPQRYIQYGIVSFGPVQCGSNSPGRYTDVRSFVSWILDHIHA